MLFQLIAASIALKNTQIHALRYAIAGFRRKVECVQSDDSPPCGGYSIPPLLERIKIAEKSIAKIQGEIARLQRVPAFLENRAAERFPRLEHELLTA